MASADETLVVVRTDHSFKSRVSEHVANHHNGAVSEAGSLQKGLLYTLRPGTTPPAFIEAFAADKVMASVVSSVLLCNESAVALAGVAARAAALVAELELELAAEQVAGGSGGGGGGDSKPGVLVRLQTYPPSLSEAAVEACQRAGLPVGLVGFTHVLFVVVLGDHEAVVAEAAEAEATETEEAGEVASGRAAESESAGAGGDGGEGKGEDGGEDRGVDGGMDGENAGDGATTTAAEARAKQQAGNAGTVTGASTTACADRARGRKPKQKRGRRGTGGAAGGGNNAAAAAAASAAAAQFPGIRWGLYPRALQYSVHPHVRAAVELHKIPRISRAWHKLDEVTARDALRFPGGGSVRVILRLILRLIPVLRLIQRRILRHEVIVRVILRGIPRLILRLVL